MRQRRLLVLTVVLVAAAAPRVVRGQESADPVRKGSLTLNEPQAATLPAGGVHAWHVELPDDQFFLVEVTTTRLDVLVLIRDPSGTPVTQIDGTESGREQARAITSVRGVWELEIHPFVAGASGDYTIEWVASRTPSDLDRKQVRIDDLQLQALSLGADGDYAAAIEALEQSLALISEISSPDDPAVLGPLTYLGGWQRQLARYDDAEGTHERALHLVENLEGPGGLQGSVVLNNLALVYQEQGRHREAEAALRRSLATKQAQLPAEHPWIGQTLQNLGLTLTTLGQQEEAERTLSRSLRILEAAFGLDDLQITSPLASLATLFVQQYRLAEAEAHALRALEIAQTGLPARHPDLAIFLNNLAQVRDAQDRTTEAEALQQRALEVWEAAFAPDHPNVAIALNNLGSLADRQKQYERADSLYRRSLAINERVLPTDHPDLGASYANLGVVKNRMGQYAESEPLLSRSLEIRRAAFGEDHPLLASSLNGLAAASLGRGNLERALGFADQAVELVARSPLFPALRITAYSQRADIKHALGDLDGALEDLDEAIRQVESLRPGAGGGEQTRAGFFQQYAKHFEQIVDWQLEAGDVERAFEYLERGRARALLDQLWAGQVDLRESIPPDLREPLAAREASSRAQVAEFQQRITLLRARDDLSAEEKLDRIDLLADSLDAAAADFESVYEELRNASALWRSLASAGRPSALRDAQRALIPEGHLGLLYEVGEARSLLFVLPPFGELPEVFRLSISDEVARSVGVEPGILTSRALAEILGPEAEGADDSGLLATLSARSSRRRVGSAAEPTRLHALWLTLVPEAVRGHINGADQILILPDSWLHQLPFEALVVEPGAEPRFWLDMGPAIRYAPSATSLYNIVSRPPTRLVGGATDVLSLSNPIYDPSELITDPSVTPDPGLVAATPERQRTGATRTESLEPLPGTALETEAILSSFGAAVSGGQIRVLQRGQATEPALRAELEGKRYLHLATHGLVEQGRGSIFAALALTPPATESTDSGNDGFLQLYEIYDLKLPEVELAVLSACDTNVGEMVEGEGIFALSRGFLSAGSRRVVASQWAVNDASTAALMGAFFRAIAEAEQRGDRLDYAIALRDAKREVRNRPEWADPFFWAPFILTGQR